MACRAVIICAFLALISACAHSSVQKVKPSSRVTMMDVYAQSVGDSQKDMARFVEKNLKEQQTFGFIQPYLPVMKPPVVRKVWIPDHKSTQDGAMLVGGHWVYLMVQAPRWFVEDEVQEAQLPVIVPAIPQKSTKEEDHGH